jgi:hypothetical protein
MSKHEDRGRVPILHVPGNAYPFANIPELGAEALAQLQALDETTLEALAEIAIAILDARQGDVELEDDTEDCCEIGEDIGSADTSTPPPCGRGCGIGSEDDAEDGESGWSNPAMPDHSPVTPFGAMRRAGR